MPQISTVQDRAAYVAIAHAAAATGVDFDYLLAQARLESGLDPAARAGTSSATGLYQFVGSTWLDTLDRHGDRHGLEWASAAIDRRGGRVRVDDPATRAQILDMRLNPDVSALMAAELARDNSTALGTFLGRAPDHAEMYLAHFLGAEGARTFLGALSASPQASAPAMFPDPAQANRAIFFDGGRPRSVGEVMDVLTAKMAAAKGQGEGLASPAAVPFASPRREPVGEQVEAHRPSMADTLASLFGSGSPGGGAPMPRQIGNAYARFRSFDL